MRLLIIFAIALSPLFSSAQNQNYFVQVGAFDIPVSLSYFQGLSDVQYGVDKFRIHKYYLRGFNNESDAAAATKKAKDLGYNAYLIKSTQASYLCQGSCGPAIDPSKITHIFFDFDKSFLRPASKQELGELYQVLLANPGYTVNLKAHTDAKGSNDYNVNLSKRRAQSAKAYLLAKGISASRINTSTFGEDTPIAKNALSGGKDTEEGRQYNRRVELEIRDAGGRLLNAIVEDIDVPDYLRN